VVTLKIRFRGFETHTRSRTLELPTAREGDIFETAWGLFRAEPWQGRPVRLIGVGVSGWEAGAGLQGDLFDAVEARPANEDERLDATLDAIRERFGEGYIQRGPQWRK
jgi:DNA polymerase-4